MPEQPTTLFTTADVEAARQRLNDNRYGGPDDVHDLDREDITEIVQIVLTATWQRAYERGLREATEGWEREWGLDIRGGGTWCIRNERDARSIMAGSPDRIELFSRLVGPWEPAQPAHVHCDHWQAGDGGCCDCKAPNWCPEEGVTPENEPTLRAAWDADPGARGPWEPCPFDTNGDGDCGRHFCPYCGTGAGDGGR